VGAGERRSPRVGGAGGAGWVLESAEAPGSGHSIPQPRGLCAPGKWKRELGGVKCFLPEVGESAFTSRRATGRCWARRWSPGGSFSGNGPGLGNVDSPPALPLPSGGSRHFPSGVPPQSQADTFSLTLKAGRVRGARDLEKDVKISPRNTWLPEIGCHFVSPPVKCPREICSQKMMSLLMAGRWNQMVFKVPSNPNHSMIL